MVVITPEAATMTKGHGGFQEVDQLPMFSTVCKDQVHVNNGARMAELTGLAYNASIRELGPVQLNIPRDFFYGHTTHHRPIHPYAYGRGAVIVRAQRVELIILPR